MKSLIGRCFCLLVLLVAVWSPAMAGRLLKFENFMAPSLMLQDGEGRLDQVVRLAIERTGNRALIATTPEKRGLLRLESGVIDGHYIRSRAAFESIDSAIIVPEPIYGSVYMVAVLDPDIELNTAEDFRKYSVGYMGVWTNFKDWSPLFGQAVPARSLDALIDMLRFERVQMIIQENNGLRNRLEQLGVEGYRILPIPVSTELLYIGLHKKHAALVEPIREQIVAMKKSGELAKICDLCAESVSEVKAIGKKVLLKD